MEAQLFGGVTLVHMQFHYMFMSMESHYAFYIVLMEITLPGRLQHAVTVYLCRFQVVKVNVYCGGFIDALEPS